MLVVGLGLIGVALYYRILAGMNLSERAIMEALVALSFGASLISSLLVAAVSSLKVLMSVLTSLQSRSRYSRR